MRLGGGPSIGRKPIAWQIVLLTLLLTVSACSSGVLGDEFVLVPGQPSAGYEHPSGIVFPADQTVGFGLEGDEVTAPGPVLRVRAGEQVTITLQNEHVLEDGSPFPAPHDFVVVAEMNPVAEPQWESATERLVTGETDTVSFSPDSPGTYYYICSVSDHMGRGMWGEFVVEP